MKGRGQKAAFLRCSSNAARISFLILSLMGLPVHVRGADIPAPPIPAEPTEVLFSAPEIITNSRGESRLLLRPADLSRFREELVLTAILEIPVPAGYSEPIDVQVEPIAREWVEGAVTWDSPWAKPGGDVDMDYVVTSRIEKQTANQVLSVDLSEIVRAWADSELLENGLLLSTPAVKGEGFITPEMVIFSTVSEAKLTVDYRKITGYGVRNGSSFLRKANGVE